jgi:IS4 transposase
MVPVGWYIEDYVCHVINFVKEQLPVMAFLFDRGFGTWGVIYRLRELKVSYLIFWKKYGDWYKEHFNELEDGGYKIIHRENKYNRDKTNHKVNSDFVLIKQLEYDGKKFDWIFATNLKLKKATSYVKIYKKRWGIETIYRVTDKIRIYTTSTSCVIRYFLFMFTCFMYNIWKFFQIFLGESFTLANHKTNLIIFMAKKGLIYPKHYDKFEMIANELFNS